MAADPLKICSESEIRRFAICFLNCDRSTVNWEAASRQFNPETKTASFKTMTAKAFARVNNALANPNDPASSESKDASPAKIKGTPQGNKRKAIEQTTSPSTKRKMTPNSKAKAKTDDVDAGSDGDD